MSDFKWVVLSSVITGQCPEVPRRLTIFEGRLVAGNVPIDSRRLSGAQRRSFRDGAAESTIRGWVGTGISGYRSGKGP
jgi:hypothetical protein